MVCRNIYFILFFVLRSTISYFQTVLTINTMAAMIRWSFCTLAVVKSHSQNGHEKAFIPLFGVRERRAWNIGTYESGWKCLISVKYFRVRYFVTKSVDSNSSEEMKHSLFGFCVTFLLIFFSEYNFYSFFSRLRYFFFTVYSLCY